MTVYFVLYRRRDHAVNNKGRNKNDVHYVPIQRARWSILILHTNQQTQYFLRILFYYLLLILKYNISVWTLWLNIARITQFQKNYFIIRFRYIFHLVKLTRKFRISYKVKYALLRIGVPYFCIHA